MKRYQQSLVLAALAALCIALPAHPQTSGSNTVSRNGYYFNSTTGAKTTVDGDQKIVEVFPNRDQNFVFSNIINKSSLAAAAADSSAILDVHNMRLGTLLFKVTPVAGGNATCRLAVQVRVHLNGGSDSLSVFAVYNYGSGPVFAAGALDTMNAGHLATGSATAPWSGETVLTFSALRNSPLNAVAATVFTYPNGVAIPLSSLTGRDFYADYISIRVRNISTTTPAAKVAVSLIGSPN